MIYKHPDSSILNGVLIEFEIAGRLPTRRRASAEWLSSLWLLALCLLGSASLAFGGERIQISEGAGKIELPDGVLKDDLFSRPLDFLRSKGGDGGSSLIPALPAPMQSSKMRKDQFEKKNWLLTSPDEQDHDSMLKKILGVREYEYDGKSKRATPNGNADLDDMLGGPSGRKSRSLTGRTIDETYGKTTIGAERSGSRSDPYSRMNGKDRLSGADSSSDDEHGSANGPIADLNLNDLLHPEQALDPLSRMSASVIRVPGGQNRSGQLFDPATLGQAPRSREQELRAQEFEKLLKGPATGARLQTDPINSLQDPTRREINPVRGNRIDDVGGTRGSALATDSLPGLGKTPRPGAFDSLNTRVLGASSLTPTVTAPPPAATRTFIPPVLEIPKRKF